jgi:menaquinol-cytochrome c reductase iron-sulfur subunit
MSAVEPKAGQCAVSSLPAAGTLPKSVASYNGMNEPVPPNTERRSFLKAFTAAAISVLLGVIPFGAGVAMFMDPLRRKSNLKGAVKVATLDAVPADGIPRKFPVIASRVDAWSKFSETPIGAVYLRRTGDGKLQAFNVVCPHAGCFVDFLPERGTYLCPCHNSTFALNGQIENRSSPAARGLDSLDVEVRSGKEIWVLFQNFQAGRAEKIPAA